jgi:hypothetical protein
MANGGKTDWLAAARRALEEGENFRAHDLAERERGDSAEKSRIMALALARSGALGRARELAGRLPDGEDSEIMGLKSRLFKDLAMAAHDPEERREWFANAAETSERVFRSKRRYYNGINAASCRFMAGDRDGARRLVREEVLPLCEAEPQRDFWLVATLGECRLLQGDYEAAKVLYLESARLANRAHAMGSFSSTIRQLRMLAEEIGPEADGVMPEGELPCVAVFSGHMIDAPGRATPRFPASAEAGVAGRLRALVAERRVAVGYASCACGGDILFLEAVLAAGGRVVVVPPLPLEKAIARSVAFAGGDWTERLRRILANPAATVLEAECDETGEDDDIVYDFCNRYLAGLAFLKARQLGLPVRGMCVWDGVDSGVEGGTDSAVRLWRAAGVEVDAVNPEVEE